MKTYAFLTKDGFRCEVLACSAKSGFKKILSIPHLKDKITKSYIEYSKDGFANLESWKTLEG